MSCSPSLTAGKGIKSGFLFKGYCFVKEFHLHAEDGEDVDDDDEEEGEVAERAQRRDDDREQHLHRRPRLRKLQHAHLKRQGV